MVNFISAEQMNQEKVVQYENQVSGYLRQRKNHVTPYFKDNELLRRGVHIEGQSVENSTSSYNVFIYNIEDGHTLDYATRKT